VTEPGTGQPEDATPPPRRSLFELEGRAAPGLYLVAWALAVAGCGSLFIAIVGSGGAGTGIAFGLGLAGIALGLAAGAGSQALQRRADGATYAGPSPVLVFGSAFAATLGVGLAVGALDLVPEGSVAVVVSVLISAAISLGLIALVVVSPGALSWRDMGFRLPGREEGTVAGDVAWGMVLAVPALFAGGLLAAVLIAILGVTPEPTIPPAREPLDVVLSLLAAAVIAPLWEEAFFRGFTTTAWLRSAGARAAIARGAVFFALIHVVTLAGSDFGEAARLAVVAFAVRLPVALLLGWVFVRRRTLVAPIALHATYNAIPVLLVALGAGAVPS
jgi:hypothetical protein